MSDVLVERIEGAVAGLVSQTREAEEWATLLSHAIGKHLGMNPSLVAHDTALRAISNARPLQELEAELTRLRDETKRYKEHNAQLSIHHPHLALPTESNDG